jgi:hypothetical protein
VRLREAPRGPGEPLGLRLRARRRAAAVGRDKGTERVMDSTSLRAKTLSTREPAVRKRTWLVIGSEREATGVTLAPTPPTAAASQLEAVPAAPAAVAAGRGASGRAQAWTSTEGSQPSAA